MTVLLVAHGGNNLKIPCMIFKSINDGLNHIKNLFNIENINDTFFFVNEDIKKNNNNNYLSYFKYLDRNFKPVGKEVLTTEFFTDYKSSNGSCNGFSFMKINENNYSKPLIEWSLD